MKIEVMDIESRMKWLKAKFERISRKYDEDHFNKDMEDELDATLDDIEEVLNGLEDFIDDNSAEFASWEECEEDRCAKCHHQGLAY